MDLFIFSLFHLLEVKQIQNQRRLSQEHPMAHEQVRHPPHEPQPPAPSIPSAAPVASGPVSKRKLVLYLPMYKPAL